MAADGFLVAVRRISPSHLDYFAFLLHISPYSHFSFAFLLCISPSHFSFAFLLRISLLRISPSHFPFAFLLNSHFSFAFLLNSHFSFTFLSFAFLLRVSPSHSSFAFLLHISLLHVSPSHFSFTKAMLARTWENALFPTPRALAPTKSLRRTGARFSDESVLRIVEEEVVNRLMSRISWYRVGLDQLEKKKHLGRVLLRLFRLFQFRNRRYVCSFWSYSYSVMNGILFRPFCSR